MNNLARSAGRLALGALLSAGALVFWIAAGVAGDLAVRHERSATLQTPPEAARDLTRWWIAPVASAVDPDLARHEATEDYWRGRYERLAGVEAPADLDDPAILLLAANAGHRASQREAAPRSPSVERLDRVIETYAGVLRNGGFDYDAAYNYEFVARRRDQAARAKPGLKPEGKTPPAPIAAAAARTDPTLPSGPTVHGRPGRHPPSTRGEEFEVLTPMDYGDREAQPEPTPGVRPTRKG